KSVAEGLAHLGRLAKVLEVDARDLLRRGYAAVREAEAALGERGLLRAFVPIWMDPLMTVNAQTYMSDALRLGGGENVFAERQRLYPLAADLGQAVPRPAGTRDTRYPRVTLDEVVKRAPRVVLLPDEPHPFSERDAEVFRAAPPPGTRVVRCGGRELSWYGARSGGGLRGPGARIRAVARRRCRHAPPPARARQPLAGRRRAKPPSLSARSAHARDRPRARRIAHPLRSRHPRFRQPDRHHQPGARALRARRGS